MGRLRAALAALAPQVAPSPSVLLDTLDELVRTNNDPDFLTATCLVRDPATGHASYASAGHPPSLLLIAGRIQRLDHALTPPITPHIPSRQRPEATIELVPGSTLTMLWAQNVSPPTAPQPSDDPQRSPPQPLPVRDKRSRRRTGTDASVLEKENVA